MAGFACRLSQGFAARAILTSMWTTPFYMENYYYEGLPVKYLTGCKTPIMVWPAEFEAAELWDYERWLRVRTLGRWGEDVRDEDEDVLRDAATAAPQDEEIAYPSKRLRLRPHLPLILRRAPKRLRQHLPLILRRARTRPSRRTLMSRKMRPLKTT